MLTCNASSQTNGLIFRKRGGGCFMCDIFEQITGRIHKLCFTCVVSVFVLHSGCRNNWKLSLKGKTGPFQRAWSLSYIFIGYFSLEISCVKFNITPACGNKRNVRGLLKSLRFILWERLMSAPKLFLPKTKVSDPLTLPPINPSCCDRKYFNVHHNI